MNHAYEGMAAAYGGSTVEGPVSGAKTQRSTNKVASIKYEENKAPWWEEGDPWSQARA